MPPLVRRAGRRDLEGIQSLWELLREDQAKGDDRLAPVIGASRLVSEHREAILADPRTGFFVAEEQGELIGFLHAQIDPNDPIYAPERYGTIVDLFVTEPSRGRGVGSQLLEYCVEWLCSHNLAEFRVATPAGNEAARRFFEARGARPLTVVQAAPLKDDERS